MASCMLRSKKFLVCFLHRLFFICDIQCEFTCLFLTIKKHWWFFYHNFTNPAILSSSAKKQLVFILQLFYMTCNAALNWHFFAILKVKRGMLAIKPPSFFQNPCFQSVNASILGTWKFYKHPCFRPKNRYDTWRKYDFLRGESQTCLFVKISMFQETLNMEYALPQKMVAKNTIINYFFLIRSSLFGRYHVLYIP